MMLFFPAYHMESLGAMDRCVTKPSPDAIMKPEVRQMVGRNLKRLRQRAGLTQDALAERLHVTRQAVSSWETGKTAPDVETLTTLAAALEVDVRALIYGPEVVIGKYVRFQRRYVVSTAVLGTLVLLWLAVDTPLELYLLQMRAQTFAMGSSLLYGLLVVPLGYAAVGVLLPLLLSLWVDIRGRSLRGRRVLLVLGLLALGYYLLWLTGFLGLWPDAVRGWTPLQWWRLLLSLSGNDLPRHGPMTLSGCALFLAFNR